MPDESIEEKEEKIQAFLHQEMPRDTSGLQLPLPIPQIDPQSLAQATPLTPKPGVDKALIELIQSVQHELRTPLHGMLALIEGARQDLKQTEEELSFQEQKVNLKRRVDDLSSLGNQLQELLDDFRDFASETISAREEEHKRDVTPNEEVDLGELMDEVATGVWEKQIQSIRAENGSDARIPPPPELILTIDTSLRGCKSVVSSKILKTVSHKLISNSLRFTNGDGYVEVTLAPYFEEEQDENGKLKDGTTEASKPRNFLRMTIEDTGEGMTKEFVSESLFEPFAKANKFKSGAGLSMALVSSLVRRLGGSMMVSSDVGRGTVISVLLPMQELPKERVGAAESSIPDQFIFFWKFEGIGLQRLAGSISSQLATFGNLYTTTSITDCDYILLPEEVCYDNHEEFDQLLEKAKPGAKIGVLQAHQDSNIHLSAAKNESLITYVTRKPFGARSFASLIRLAKRSKDSTAEGLDGERLADNGGEALGTNSLSTSQPSSPPSTSQSLSNSTSASTSNAEGTSSKHSKSGRRDSDLMFSASATDDVLRKPVPATRMLSPLEMGSELPSVDGKRETSPPKVVEFSALVVEDNMLNLRILTRILAQLKIPFFTAADGVEAVEQFQKHRPALVLLDINMPRMDGYEACKRIKGIIKENPSEDAWHYVAAITALSDEYSRKKGFESSFDAWYTKPLNLVKFKATVSKWKTSFDNGELVVASPLTPSSPNASYFQNLSL